MKEFEQHNIMEYGSRRDLKGNPVYEGARWWHRALSLEERQLLTDKMTRSQLESCLFTNEGVIIYNEPRDESITGILKAGNFSEEPLR